MGLVSRLLTAAVSLLLIAGTLGFVLWFFDYGLEATVQDKQCHAPSTFGSETNTSQIAVKTKILGILHVVKGVSSNVCAAVQDGNFVIYHLKSGRTSLYRSDGGACLYDSVGGPGGCAVA